MNSDEGAVNGKWLLKQLSNWEIIKEMIMQVQGQEMPKLMIGLIYCSMLVVYPHEKNILNRHWNDP